MSANERSFKRRAVRVALFILAGVVIVAGLLRVRFDVNVLNLLPSDLPSVQGLKLYQEHFAKARELIVTLQHNDADNAESAARSLAERLRAQSNLVRGVVWQPPWMEQPRDAAALVGYLWLNGSPTVFSNLATRLSGTNLIAAFEATRERLATTLSPDELARLPYDPLDLLRPEAAGRDRNRQIFASEDGTFRMLFVQPATELETYREAGAWLDKVRAVVASWKTQQAHLATTSVALTGGPAFTSEIARGMERDTTSSVLGTMAVIAVLFWCAHRRWRPLLWLLCLLLLILAGTLAIAGLIIGSLNVVSTGFAAILLGLAVDYGLVLYQEWRAAPALSPREIRQHVGRGIVWSAVTTAGAFATLNFGGLPGLAQLGTMVAAGISIAAFVMLYAYLGPLAAVPHNNVELPAQSSNGSVALFALVIIVILIAITLFGGFPKLDASSEALRPRNSTAYAAMQQIEQRIGGEHDPMWVLVSATNEIQMQQRLSGVDRVLQTWAGQGKVENYDLPIHLWPNVTNQLQNLGVAQQLVSLWPKITAVAEKTGFSTNSLLMTEAIFRSWEAASQRSGSEPLFWPDTAWTRWMMDKMVARDDGHLFVAGMLHGAKHPLPTDQLTENGALLAGWQALGRELLGVVSQRTSILLLSMFLILCVSLWFAFRRWEEMALSLASLSLALLCLLTIMRWAGWSWNLMNLMALPLLLGTGIDYSIHIQSALRRFGGDARMARRVTGRALWLCGGTTIAGFGSLAWSSNRGLASLGCLCATGIACAMLVSIYLLPPMWKSLAWDENKKPPSKPIGPSALYRNGVWRMGLLAARLLPMHVAAQLMRRLAQFYWAVVPARREIVIQNLLPALQGDRDKATSLSKELFGHFGAKLVDLWRFEIGQSPESLLVQESGWEHFAAARESGRGVLVVTPHLGNWEYGGPLLARRGIQLHVVTQVEPGEGFTELRSAGRSRWGIRTLVIGDQPFAVIEVIKLLERGGVVALLMDRPPGSSAVTVELFGRPFQASMAVAELARASGCAVLPVALPRLNGGYAAHILPELAYDRGALNKREARAEFTQRIMRGFEPLIRQYLNQWYHFVPVWPRSPL